MYHKTSILFSSAFLISQLCLLLTACDNTDDSKDNNDQEVGDKYFIKSYGVVSADPVKNLTGMWMLVANFPHEGAGLTGSGDFPAVVVMGSIQERRIVAIQDYDDGTGIISSCDPAFGDIAWNAHTTTTGKTVISFEKRVVWGINDIYVMNVALEVIDNRHMEGAAAQAYSVIGTEVKTTEDPQALVDMVKITHQVGLVGEVYLNIGDEPLIEGDPATDTELFEYGISCFYEQEATEFQFNFSAESEDGGSFARISHKLGIVGELLDSNELVYLDFEVLDSAETKSDRLTSNFISFKYPLGQDFMRAGFTTPAGSFGIDHGVNDKKLSAHNSIVEDGSGTYQVDIDFTDFKLKAETDDLLDKFASGSIDINLNF